MEQIHRKMKEINSKLAKERISLQENKTHHFKLPQFSTGHFPSQGTLSGYCCFLQPQIVKSCQKSAAMTLEKKLACFISTNSVHSLVTTEHTS